MCNSKKTPAIHPGTVLENGTTLHSRRHVPGTPVPCSSPDRPENHPETAGGTHTCCGNCPDCTCRGTDAADRPGAV